MGDRLMRVMQHSTAIKLILTILLISGWVAFLVAQSPRNLVADVNPSNGFNTAKKRFNWAFLLTL